MNSYVHSTYTEIMNSSQLADPTRNLRAGKDKGSACTGWRISAAILCVAKGRQAPWPPVALGAPMFAASRRRRLAAISKSH
jgi:hypothetical protein